VLGFEVMFNSTRDSVLCGWSSTTFLFVNIILEQVVGVVGSGSLFLPCDVGLLHYWIIWSPSCKIVGCWGESLVYFWVMKT
jgi:hypothetical protein